MKYLFLLLSVTFSFSCLSQESVKNRPVSIEMGKIFENEGRKYLFGGEKDTDHFDITNCELKDGQFHYGIGRERFPALIEPEFISFEEADRIWNSEDRFLLLVKGNTVKAYSIEDLTRHEVVNDVVEGEPIMAAYCILADLGAIYSRTYHGKEFTFALSGYTYYDNEVWDGMDGFIMWDRETESLWWPLIGKAVSGTLNGTSMITLDEKYWSQTTWGNIREHFPEVRVLRSGQDFERPDSWRTYTDLKLDLNKKNSLAPRWGKNDTLGK